MITSPPKSTADELSEGQTYFPSEFSTLNSAVEPICFPGRPCKRPHCHTCVALRRNYFVTAASRHSRLNDARCFVTVSWPGPQAVDPWQRLFMYTKELLGHVNRQIEFIIWVRAFGDSRGTPHLHLLTTTLGAERVYQIVRRLWPNRSAFVQVKNLGSLNDHIEICGYLFDRNLIPMIRSPKRRPRGRSISGTRGISYGFPKQKDLDHLPSLIAAENGHLPKNPEIR